MSTLSQSEKDYIRQIMLKNKRIDGRYNNQQRNLTFELLLIPQSDSALRVCNGNSILEIILKFETSETYTLNCNMQYENLGIIDNILQKHKIGLSVIINIIKDDGGIMSMYYEGMKHIFANITVPKSENLRYDEQYSVELPTFKTYALFESNNVIDPTKNEELSCDGLVHIYTLDNKVIGCEVENAVNVDYYALEAVIQCNQ